jgi:pyruvate ferredoxin oxidoreductase beta subunit/2-oxoisovalerate ferredoxin oxidoreductase beta subunit
VRKDEAVDHHHDRQHQQFAGPVGDDDGIERFLRGFAVELQPAGIALGEAVGLVAPDIPGSAQGRKEVTVLAWAGDGGTFDIGLQSISGAAERGEDIIYVCYDNEAYMNTGIQQSSATPPGAWTTTTPSGKEFRYAKKDILGIVRAHNPAYLASAPIAYPEDFYAKFEKAKKARGFRFLHLLAACPSGWKIDSSESLKVTRMAVESGVFPLREMDGNGNLATTVKPEKRIPVADYLKAQGRFRKISEEEIAIWQARVEKE